MVELEYLIIYTNSGIPIYSYKFDPDFQISDDFLISAFLASLNQYSMTGPHANRPDSVILDNGEVAIEYSDELKLSTLDLGNTVLIFYYGESDKITVGLGVNKRHFGPINTLFSLTQLMVEIEQFMQRYEDLDWTNTERSLLDDLETDIHFDVIHNFMDAHTVEDSCYLEIDCPYKTAEEYGIGQEEIEKDSLRSRIRNRFSRS